MTQTKSGDLDTAIKDIAAGIGAPVYLVIGERFLARESTRRLVAALLPEPAAGMLHEIDGDEEDYRNTIALLRTYNLFGGRHIVLVRDSRLFMTKKSAAELWSKVSEAQEKGEEAKAASRLDAFFEASGIAPPEEGLAELPAARWQELFGMERPETDLSWTAALLARLNGKKKDGRDAAGAADSVMSALAAGLPPGHVLLLTAETVDRRSRFFKFIKDSGVVIDGSVATAGSKSADKKAQEEVIRALIARTVAAADKSLEAGVMDILLERIGFYPSAAVLETEKLVYFVGKRQAISRADLDQLVGRTREEAVFELTEKISQGRLADSLESLTRLRQAQVHDLAILATIRNFFHRLLVFRSLLDRPGFPWQRNISFPLFQQKCLPLMKEVKGCEKLLGKNPYGLYMDFKKAENFSRPLLRRDLFLVLEAEDMLKGSGLPAVLIMENLVFGIFSRKNDGERQT